MTRPGQRGFTLVEILIAVAILGVMIVLLNQAVGFGLRASAMQAGSREQNADIEVVDRTLRRLIARADPGQFPEPATLRGTATALSLTTELPLAADGAPQRAAATLLAANGQLRLRWIRLRHVQPVGTAPPAHDTVLLNGVSELRLACVAVDGGAWSSNWKGDRLPALVRIQIVFAKPSRHWPPMIAAPRREPVEE